MKYWILAICLLVVGTTTSGFGTRASGTATPGPDKYSAPAKLPDWTGRSIAHGDVDSRMIALTFDDGPNPDTTPDILRVLAKYNAKGTFFLIGRRVDKYPDLVRQIKTQGHEIGNHSYTHPRMSGMTKDAVYAEYARCSEAIKKITGFNPELCRPPGGNANGMVINVAGALGMRSVAWSINVGDYDLNDADTVQAKVTTSAASGDIVLLHDKVYATIICLDDMLASLQRQGYRCVTVSDLMENCPDSRNRPYVPKGWMSG